jgi:uncharacterized membrane protein YphA (DoxX/SURF4 family)
MQIVIRIVIGFLLVIHGFAHWNITTAWGSRQAEESWLLSNRGVSPEALHSLGNVLWIVALLAFIAAGVVLFVGAPWWRILAVASSIISLLTIGLFWQPNMVIGAAVDVGILLALLWVHWPTTELVGA